MMTEHQSIVDVVVETKVSQKEEDKSDKNEQEDIVTEYESDFEPESSSIPEEAISRE